MFFQWIQLLNSIPLEWKKKIKQNKVININNLVVKDHNFIRNGSIATLDKLTCKDIYFILLDKKEVQPTSQRYFETLFDNNTLVWKEIYLLPRLAAIKYSSAKFPV